MIAKLILHFHPGHLVFVLFLALGIAFPNAMEHGLDDATTWFAAHFGWLVMLTTSFFVALAAYLAMSRYGQIRLGGEEARPQFSTLSWLAMLFAAGMGTGLIFYGAAEPLFHFQTPPPSAAKIVEEAVVARRALAITFFHWGIHAWTIYAIAALTIAFFTFQYKQPMLPSVPMKFFLPHRLRSPVGALIDTLAILGVVFGLVASMSAAILQLSEGLKIELLPQMDQTYMQLAILAVMFVCYTVSASTGLGKGIKILSDINMGTAILVMLFIIACGPTLFILNNMVSATGDYLSGLISLSFNTRPYSDIEGWTNSWSITYFLWWISWGPFVGVFVARISRGRTIRGFLTGVILAPTAFSIVWFSALGVSALQLEIVTQPGFADGLKLPAIIFQMLDYFPLETFLPIIVLALLFIFLVTSADSGTYVLGMFTNDGQLQPPVWDRLFWGVIVALVTAGAIMSGRGNEFFRAFAVVGSIPYLSVMIWQSVCLLKQLRRYRQDGEPEPEESLASSW